MVAKKASSTLSTVKNRLKKHLSKDSGITTSKRHSRASVGTSEAEIERRAELRRIRHKRIQEELSNEGIYDDDAKSLSTLDAATSSGLQERALWIPRESLTLPVLALPSLVPINSPSTASNVTPITLFNRYASVALTLPDCMCIALTFSRKGPMLEALYYGLASPEPSSAMPNHEEFFAEWSTTMVNSSATRSRRYSSPAASSPTFEIPEPNVYRPTRKRSSLPQLPKAPTIQPQRLPSIVEPVKSSWRLSFSADNRGEHLRKLSQGTNIPALLSPEKMVASPQSMRKWLHSQGLRSSSQAMANSDDASTLDCAASHSRTCTASQDFGGVDGGGDFSNALHLHEMGIPQRLVSKGLHSSCSSPQLSTVGSRTHQRGMSSISAISRVTHKSRGRHLQNTTDSVPLSERIPQAWGSVLENDDTIQDGTSSFYPSTANSIQPSPKSSRFNLFSLMAGSKSRADLTLSKSKSTFSLDHVPDIEPPPSTFMSLIIPHTPLSQTSIPVASASSGSLPLPCTSYYRRPTVDTNSTIVSETDSFREREAELSAVRTRFAAAEARRSPSTPRSSKFREEFDFAITPMEEAMPTKSSAFARLAKFAARSFDGPFERKMGTPMTPFMSPAYEPDELNHHSKHAKGALNPVASPLEDDSVIGLWGNAVKRNADPNAKVIATNLHIPGKKRSQEARKKSHISNSSKDKKKFALKGLGWGMGDEDSGSDSEKKGNPEDDWEAELARVAQKAKGKSRAIVKKLTEPDRRYPESWSKFSSHDRHERTSSAKTDDKVQVKDFATDGSEFLDDNKKTLREKIQKRLVAEFDKQATAEVQNNTEGTFGRRSSMRPAGDLEFPELEVLPLQSVSLMSHEEIAEHVEEVLREEELDRKEEELDAIFGGPVRRETVKEKRPSLAKRVTAKVTPQHSGSKGSQNASLMGTNTSDKMESKASARPSADAPVRRGPVARKPGEQPTPSAPKPAPKIAPPVAMPDLPARRGPVTRKHGEQSASQKPAPKIAPPVIMPARTATRGGAARAIGIMDGNTDHGDEDSVAAPIVESEVVDSEISIADPRFYDDCIVNKTPGPETGRYCGESEEERSDEMSFGMGSKKGKYSTWSGRDWDKYRRQDRRSLGTLMLRKSTDEVLRELERMEKAERENTLRAAEEAWGSQ